MVNFTEFLNCTVGNASVEYSHCLDDVPAYEDCPDPSVCEDDTGDNVGLAFGLTIGAGFATTLGALLPFVPFIKRRSTRFLAAAMALAAGVMLYVSFTEIRTKSLNSFCCVSPDHYDVLATSCFFGGILFTAVLDALVWALQKVDCGFTVRIKLKRVKFSNNEHEAGGDGILGDERAAEEGWRKRGPGKAKAHHRLHAVNGNGFNMDKLDATSALILPPHSSRHCESSTKSSSQSSTTPTANSLEEGCDAALEEGVIDEAAEEEKPRGAGVGVETRGTNEDGTSIQHSQTQTGELGWGGPKYADRESGVYFK